jgi:hypothetical protein
MPLQIEILRRGRKTKLLSNDIFYLTSSIISYIIWTIHILMVLSAGSAAGAREGLNMAAQSKDKLWKPSVVPPIGALLVAEEYIIPQDLDFALEHQKHSKGLIGEILVRIGAVEPNELERVLSIQKKMTGR